MTSQPETITWHATGDALPDDECTVLIASPRLDPPVWMGFLSANQWFSVDAMPLRDVTHWADIPAGPGSTATESPVINPLADFQ